jgi:rSAM/selenodomain-associated transferase 1
VRRSTLAVIAKTPAPGVSKTRLCPPCTQAQAAALAAAALADTLDAVAATPTGRRVVVLAGAPIPLPRGVDVIPQRGDGLAERLAAAFVDLGGPTLVIGMDTPQVTPRLLSQAMAALEEADAVLGPALDGGYWAIGLRRPDPAAFRGVPMSEPSTGAAQRERLRVLGFATAELPELRDVDRIADARAVAAQAPGTRFARGLAALESCDLAA